MVKPLSPEEAISKKITVFPDFVIEAFNTTIMKNLTDGTRRARATFTQDEVIAAIIAAAPPGFADNPRYDKNDIFNNRWLDVEDIYEQYGWTVEYEKPGYNETGNCSFTFKKKK